MFFGPNHVLVKNCAAQSVFFFYTFLEVKNLNKLIKIAQIWKKSIIMQVTLNQPQFQ